MIIRSLVNNCDLCQLCFFWDQVCTPESDPVKLKVVVVVDAAFRCVCVCARCLLTEGASAR